ncbi:MAG TPA: pyridoxal phosphate-dependent aminotransferase [Nitrospinota bacterium]|nr:pyridoxal phosphate-dependent aminotransferase [Nitrospinota bacterium]|tara:strand:- start:124246 stop:125466 length:1221 start_codon:yes stop_codon:yes gene_type:complete
MKDLVGGPMPIAKEIAEMIEKSSWIRKMFDEGAMMKARLGDEAVCDFTLGNPFQEPSHRVINRLRELVLDDASGTHKYMQNAGFPWVREKIAEHLRIETDQSFTPNHLIMTVGAGGGLNVILRAICDPDDDVIITAPYFAEYIFYTANHRARAIVVETDEHFQLIPEKIKEAIGPKTRAVLLNSPNNPSGAVYPEEALAQLGEILREKSSEHNRPIFLIMDEPYRKLLYDGVKVPWVFGYYDQSMVVTSHSKDLNLPGERIGYVAVNPKDQHAEALINAMVLTNRILGFVNAPALFQRLVAELQAEECDMSIYKKNRDILVNGLSDIGYNVISPKGGFYLFPKSPDSDDEKFTEALKEKNILVVPGKGFGRAGYFRVAFCLSTDVCERALLGFREVYKGCGISQKS